MKFAIAFLFAFSVYGQQVEGPRVQSTCTFASPPSTPATGMVCIFTDASAVGTCSGGGTALATCRYSGSAWQAVSGGGGGTSVNVNGSSVSSPNFNATTPAVESGYTAAKFQVSGSSVSAEVLGLTFTECRIVIDYTDAIFQAAATTVTKTACAMPAAAVPIAVFAKASAAWAGTSVTAATIGLGRSGTGNDQDYLASCNIFQSVGDTVLCSAPGGPVDMSAHNMLATFTSNVNVGTGSATILTAGSVTIIVWYRVVTL